MSECVIYVHYINLQFTNFVKQLYLHLKKFSVVMMNYTSDRSQYKWKLLRKTVELHT